MNTPNAPKQAPWALRTHEEMRDVLMAPDAKGPDIHYYMIRGGNIKKNITILESGTIDGEYIKTYGHYHVDGLGETYTVLSGEGVVLLQKRKKKEDGSYLDNEIASITAIFVKPGSTVTIPPDAGHLIVNTTEDEWLITTDNSPVALQHEAEASWPSHADYKPLKNLHGFAYYIVKESSGPQFVKNPLYKDVPEIIIEHA